MINRTPLLTNYNIDTLYKNHDDIKKNYKPLQEPDSDDLVSGVRFPYNDESKLFEAVSKGTNYIREIGKELLEQGKDIIDDPSTILQRPVHTLGIAIALYFYKTAVTLFGLATLFGYLEKTSNKDVFFKRDNESLSEDNEPRKHFALPGLFHEKKRRTGI